MDLHDCVVIAAERLSQVRQRLQSCDEFNFHLMSTLDIPFRAVCGCDPPKWRLILALNQLSRQVIWSVAESAAVNESRRWRGRCRCVRWTQLPGPVRHVERFASVGMSWQVVRVARADVRSSTVEAGQESHNLAAKSHQIPPIRASFGLGF